MSISSILRFTPFSIGILKCLIITSLIFFCTLLSGCNKNDLQKEKIDEQPYNIYNSDIEEKLYTSENSQKEVDNYKLDEKGVSNRDLDKENYQEYENNKTEEIKRNEQEELSKLNKHQQNTVNKNTYEEPVETNQQTIINKPEEKLETKITNIENNSITNATHEYFIGNTKIAVHRMSTTYQGCLIPSRGYLSFINLDNTLSGNDHVIKILNSSLGSTMYLDYGNKNSTIKFNFDGNKYGINPKYLFNNKKIRSDLQKQKNYSSQVFHVVKNFSSQLLNEILLGNDTIIDLSDNRDLFNLMKKNIASEDTLYICKENDCLKGDNYVIVTSNSMFTELKKEGKFNVLLYANQLHDSGTLIENISQNTDSEYYPNIYINLYSNNTESYEKMLTLVKHIIIS